MTLTFDTDVPFKRDDVAAAWRAFIDGQPLPSAAPRQLILESWLRCQQSKLDPFGALAPRLDEADFEQRKNANRNLLDAAEETWRSLKDSLVASHNLFVLTDADGVILLVKGEKDLVREAARRGTAPAHQWSERSSGTNAIGTAVETGEPVLTRSEEHYCERAKVWDCAAAPVRDLSDDKLIGILDVTSAGDLSDHHTLALAVTVARQIEYTLHSQELAAAIQLHHWYRHSAKSKQSTSHLLVDRSGKVLHASGIPDLESLLPELRITVDTKSRVMSPNNVLKITKTTPYAPAGEQGDNGWYGGIVDVSFRNHERDKSERGSKGLRYIAKHAISQNEITKPNAMMLMPLGSRKYQ